MKRINSKSSLNSTRSACRLVRISFNISTYWNDLEVISWYSVTNATRMVGNLKLYGIEPEISYKWSYGKAGINYSLVKQSDWNLAQDVLSSGISYSQYNLPLRNSSAVQTGLGNDLNNWPNQSLKIFGQVDFSDSFTFHMDARILWDFQGAKDGLSALRSAVTGQPEQSAVEAAIQKALANGTYDYDLRLNASLSYKLKKNMTIYLFSQNLLGSNKNKRYAFDTGIDRASPHRIRFVEEPRTFGMRFEYKH